MRVPCNYDTNLDLIKVINEGKNGGGGWILLYLYYSQRLLHQQRSKAIGTQPHNASSNGAIISRVKQIVYTDNFRGLNSRSNNLGFSEVNIENSIHLKTHIECIELPSDEDDLELSRSMKQGPF